MEIASPNSKCQGIEINTEAAERATSKGLPVTTRSLSEMACTHPGEFDVVCAFQVLEHLSDPKVFLEQVCSLLSQNGRLILSVPNRDCSLGLDRNPLDFPPHHMSRWAAETFSNISKFFPLELQDVIRQPLMREEYDRLLSTLACRSSWLRGLFGLPGSRRLARALLALGGSRAFYGQSIIAHYQRRS
jgi:SAM-dependent methyltransferase